MQGKVTQKTIAFVFKSSRLTADVLKKVMKMYLEHRKQGKQASHGISPSLQRPCLTSLSRK